MIPNRKDQKSPDLTDPTKMPADGKMSANGKRNISARVNKNPAQPTSNNLATPKHSANPTSAMRSTSTASPSRYWRNKGIKFSQMLLSEKVIAAGDLLSGAISLSEDRNLVADTKSNPSTHKISMLVASVSCFDVGHHDPNASAGDIDQLALDVIDPIDVDYATSLERIKTPPRAAAISVRVENITPVCRALIRHNIEVSAVIPKLSGESASDKVIEANLEQIAKAIETGANEIEIGIDSSLCTTNDWLRLHEVISTYRRATGKNCLKIVVPDLDLPSITDLAKTTMTALMAGADYIVTQQNDRSTDPNITPALVIIGCIRTFAHVSDITAGFKFNNPPNSYANLLTITRAAIKLWDYQEFDPKFQRINATSVLPELNDIVRQFRNSPDIN